MKLPTSYRRKFTRRDRARGTETYPQECIYFIGGHYAEITWPISTTQKEKQPAKERIHPRPHISPSGVGPTACAQQTHESSPDGRGRIVTVYTHKKKRRRTEPRAENSKWKNPCPGRAVLMAGAILGGGGGGGGMGSIRATNSRRRMPSRLAGGRPQTNPQAHVEVPLPQVEAARGDLPARRPTSHRRRRSRERGGWE